MPNQQMAAIALGSNLGDRLAMLRSAVTILRPFVNVLALSPVYETAAVYVTDQPAFLNAVVLGTTELSPEVLLKTIKQLESDMGRIPSFPNGPRAIDMDLIFVDHLVVESPTLQLPHPRMAEREFVLRPLADVAPSWKHPLLDMTVTEMLAKIPTENPRSLGRILEIDIAA